MLAAGLSCLGSASAASAATTGAPANGAELQTAASTALQSFFDMDANVQLNDGYTSINQSQTDIATAAGTAPLASINAATSTDATQLASMLTRHANAAEFTFSQGGPVWDSVKTTVSDLKITAASATEIDATVDVTNVFHIEGQPVNGGPMSISAEENPYTVVLSNVGGQWRLASVELTPIPTGQSAADVVASLTSGGGTGSAIAQPAPAASSKDQVTPNAATAATYYNANAYQYAYDYYQNYNPAYESFSDDCMNFVSQIIAAGGEAEGSVWYPYSASWVNVQDFWVSGRQWYSPDNGVHHPQNSDNSAINPGDLTAWQWSDTMPIDFNHEMYVDNKIGNTLELAAHTNNRWNYPSSSVFADEPAGTYFVAERPNGI